MRALHIGWDAPSHAPSDNSDSIDDGGLWHEGEGDEDLDEPGEWRDDKFDALAG